MYVSMPKVEIKDFTYVSMPELSCLAYFYKGDP